ncbi:MAG TPA: integrase core domain-containing protein [Candidatus Dormibacteraeota bacterium]|nr:integrase core domain-containing protein [Candidatus Dormibacteraeota bacterium]
MSNRVGSSTIYSTILPNNAAWAKVRNVQLSREAKFRLRVIEHYLLITKNVNLTCRHYAITRSYFYKWYKRFNPRNLDSLEDLSRRPKRLRPTTYNYDLVKLVRKLRTAYPRYSSKKLAVILKRDFSISYSAATIGRIIKKFSLYFSKVIRVNKNRRSAIKAWVVRKPKDLAAQHPRQVIEFDMKHIYVLSRRYYGFVAVDPYTKQAVVHVATRPSSYQAKLALEKVLDIFGKDICILNDNGSENFGKALAYLRDQNITQYFARPRTPKDKPHVENLIGKLQQECLDEHGDANNLEELQEQITEWVNDYHFFRPHQSLNYQTPQEFCDTLDITIPRARLSTM